MSRLDGSDDPAALSPSSEAIISIRVGNQRGASKKGTYAIKEDLRAEGYRWDPQRKVWHTTAPVAGFSFAVFHRVAD